VSSAYVILNERLNLNIALIEINALLLHEEIIPELLEHLSWSIKKDGCLNHPIIVDAESLLVLDGVHRVEALKRLRCKCIPACLVDYKSPSIQVFNWYRVIGGVDNLRRLLSEVKTVGGSVEKVDKIKEGTIGKSLVAAAIRTFNENFLVNHPFKSLPEAFDIIKRVEERLKNAGFSVGYETESDALQRLSKRQVDAVLCTPKLTKQAIIETARSGKTFVYKATRHVIPARPMRLCVPLNLLRDKRPLSKLNETLKSLLLKKKMKHLSPGSLFEGRRYEEDLYVFEE